jgi:hypothetical protein
MAHAAVFSQSAQRIDFPGIVETLLLLDDFAKPDQGFLKGLDSHAQDLLASLEKNLLEKQRQILERVLARPASKKNGLENIKGQLSKLFLETGLTLAAMDCEFQDRTQAFLRSSKIGSRIAQVYESVEELGSPQTQALVFNSHLGLGLNLDFSLGSRLRSFRAVSQTIALNFLKPELVSPPSLRLYLMCFREGLPAVRADHAALDLTPNLLLTLGATVSEKYNSLRHFRGARQRKDVLQSIQAARPSRLGQLDPKEIGVICEPLLFLLHPSMTISRPPLSLFLAPERLKAQLQGQSLSRVSEEVFETLLRMQVPSVLDFRDSQKKIQKMRLEILELGETLRQEQNLEFLLPENLILRGNALEDVLRRRLISKDSPDLTLMVLKRMYQNWGIATHVFEHLEEVLAQVVRFGKLDDLGKDKQK